MLKEYLQNFVVIVREFLNRKLKISLHERKIIIRKLKQGIDFLGYVVLPRYRILRTKTKRRMIKRINIKNQPSYLGLLKHCNGYKIFQKIEQRYKIRYNKIKAKSKIQNLY